MDFVPFETRIRAVPSNDGQYIASFTKDRLIVIRRSTSLEVVRSTGVPWSIRGATTLKWSPRELISCDLRKTVRNRLLLANEKFIRVWDTDNPSFCAQIDNVGDGFKAVNIGFGATCDEIFAFSDLGIGLSIWRLDVRGRRIRCANHKFSTPNGYDWRPKTGHFAMILSTESRDCIILHQPVEYMALHEITVIGWDIQGLKWSPDGRWLMVWNSPSSGFRLSIYTADGQLYRNILSTSLSISDSYLLGVKMTKWISAGEHIAIGLFDNRVVIIDHTTFTEKSILDHPTMIEPTGHVIYQEIQHAQTIRCNEYARATQTVNPPRAKPRPGEVSIDIGIASIDNSADGLYVATATEDMPTTIWIWETKDFKLQTVLIHHRPVTAVSWHPTISDLLLIQCKDSKGMLYFWKSSWRKPQTVRMDVDTIGEKAEAQWIWTEPPKSISPGASPSALVDLVNRDRSVSFIYSSPSKWVACHLESVDSDAIVVHSRGIESVYEKEFFHLDAAGEEFDSELPDDTFQFRQT